MSSQNDVENTDNAPKSRDREPARLRKLRKIKKILLRVVIIFVIVNLLLALPVGSLVEVLVLKGKGNREITQEQNVKDWLKEEVEMDADEFEEIYQMSAFKIPSTKTAGYEIPVFHYLPEGEAVGFIVMAHGINASHIAIYPEAEIFLKQGLEVYSMDARKFGESTWSYVSYGYYEGMDVEDVFAYALQNSPKEYLAGLWGESMGGAACENAMDAEVVLNNLDFAVLDCPLGAMEELTGAPKIQNRLAGIMNRPIAGYSFEDQNPYPQMAKQTAPTLLILAGKDRVIPAVSTARIKEALENAPAEVSVFISPEAPHADVVIYSPQEYAENVEKLLELAGQGSSED